MFYKTILLTALLFVFAACSPAAEEPTTALTLEATEDAEAATPTPMDVQGAPAIELLAGAADSCTNPEDYGQVLGFAARYENLTTEHRVQVRLMDAEGNELTVDRAPGENQDGEQAYGFYPLAYDVPAESLLTVEVMVFMSAAEDAAPVSTSIITYNCTTGEVISSSFERS